MSGGNGSGRDSLGRFVVGHNMPGPGRNRKSRQNEMVKRVMLETITPDDIDAIMRKIITKAKAGDLYATKVFLDRMLGLPAQCISLEVDSSMDGYMPDERYR